MKTLKHIIKEADDIDVAIGHFNISNIEGMWAIFESARNMSVPVIVGLSEGERDFVGVKQSVALVRSLRAEFDYPIFINADHTYSVERCKEAIDAGFDAVIYDGAGLSMEENIINTGKVVDYARKIAAEEDREILVEGELGYIGTSSKVLDDIPDGVSLENLTTQEDAKMFVAETGIDILAPAVGNIHGMLKNAKNPELNIARIKEIHDAVDVPLVLHGGSGISDENFRDAIQNGISVVHINTEIRRAYRAATEQSFIDNPNEIAPYRLMKPAVEAMREVIEGRLRLFNNF